MKNLVNKYRQIIILSLVLVISSANSSLAAGSYTWNGNTSTNWFTSSNWTPNGVPGSGTTVTIVSASNNPSIASGNVTISKLIMTSGTLNTGIKVITITDSAFFNGGTITGTASNAIQVQGAYAKFAGTTIDAEISVISGVILLNGSTFNTNCYFKHTGNAKNHGLGNNTFNGPVTVVNKGGEFSMAETSANTFNDDLLLYVDSLLQINVSEAGGNFNGNIYVNSKANGIYFGAVNGGNSILADGKVIAVGDSGFITGTLLLRNFIQEGSTAQELTLTGNKLVLNCIDAEFNGDVDFTASAIVIKSTSFYGTTAITQTGSTGTNWDGRNNFYSDITITNTGAAMMRTSFTDGDAYYGQAAFVNTHASGKLYACYNGNNEIGGSLVIDGDSVLLSQGGGKIKFNGSGEQSISGTKPVGFYDLTIDKESGSVTCDTSITVSDTLKFVKGNLVTTSSRLLTMKAGSKAIGASDSSLVSGPVKKFGNSAFVFPVGKDSSYRAAEITAPSSATDAFTAEYFDTGQTLGDSTDTTIVFLTYCNYWYVTRNTGSSSVYITLNWDIANCGLGDTTNLLIAQWQTNKWANIGKGTITGYYAKGSIKTPAALSTFGYLTVGYSKIEFLVNDSIPFSDGTTRDTCGGSLDDMGYSIKQTYDGGYIVAGSTASYGAGGKDVYLIKLEDDGDTTWTKTFGGADDEEAFSVVQCRDTGYVIAGYTRSYGSGAKDIYVVKTNKNGVSQWTKTYGTGEDEEATSIFEMSDSTLILTGYARGWGAGNKDVILMKLENDGDSLWKKTYGGSSNDAGNDVIAATGGGFIICGSTASSGAGQDDIYVIKTDASGTSSWTHTYGGSGTDIGYAITVCTKGGYLLTGKTTAYEANGTDALLLKIETDGDTVFTHVYGGSGTECFYDLTEHTDGSIFMCGYSNSYGNGSNDAYTVRTDHWGDKVDNWLATAAGDDEVRSCIVNSDGNGLATGHSKTTSESTFNVQSISYPFAWWRPRQLWVNNFWCPAGNGCQGTNLLDLSKDPVIPISLLNNPNPLAMLVLYCNQTRIRTIILGNVSPMLYEETNDPLPPYSLIDEATNINGDDIRDYLSEFIVFAKSHQIDRVLIQLRDKTRDEDAQIITYLEGMMDRVVTFNANHTGQIDGVIAEHEYGYEYYGDPNHIQAPWNYADVGYYNMLDAIDYCVSNAGSLTVGAYCPRSSVYLQNGDIPLPDAQACDILDRNPDEIYSSFTKQDQTSVSGCDNPEHSTWPNYWNDNTLQTDDQFDIRIKHFGSNVFIPCTNTDLPKIFPVLHVNDFNNQNFLGNYMLGGVLFPCGSGNPVYVPQVENDFIGQYYDYECEMKHFEDPLWRVNLRDISWFRYSFEPLYNFRPGDGLPSNRQVICPAFRIAHFANSSENVLELPINENQPFIISPNPFTDNVKIIFKENENSTKKDVTIFNMLGSDITSNFIIESDRNQIIIKPVTTISPGIFTCRFIKNGRLFTVKLIRTDY